MKMLLGLAAAWPAVALAAATVGQPAPSFTVTDLAGRPAKLEDYRGRTVVLEWNNFSCPFVLKHYRSGNMQALQKRYGKDVAWLMVNSTHRQAEDYREAAAIEAQLKDFGAAPARYLMDDPGAVGRAYGAKVTPHMFILDGQGKVVYNGAIDDRRSTNPEDVKGARNYVAAALDEMQAGKPVRMPSTTPYGCSVHYR